MTFEKKEYNKPPGSIGIISKGKCSYCILWITWKYGIMGDLHDFRLTVRLPEFLKNFLSNRIFQVRIESILCDSKTQDGVPQRSILSVTLFCIKINEIAKNSLKVYMDFCMSMMLLLVTDSNICTPWKETAAMHK